MSSQFGKLCSYLLLEYFGEIIHKVGCDLLKWGTKPLRLIVATTRLPVSKVKQSLRILIQYGLVTFGPSQIPTVAEYTLKTEKVVLLLRYPRYLLLMKTKYGDESEIMVEEILRVGQDTASNILLKAAKRLKEKGEKNVNLVTLRDKLFMLINKQFLMRCPNASEEAELPVLTVKERELYLAPELNMKALNSMEKGSKDSAGDSGVYWRVNYDRFHQDFRDQVMIEAITRRVDKNAGELMRQLLNQMYLRTEPWAATSNPIPYTELKEAVRKLNTFPQLQQYLDQYLKLLEEDSSQFVNKGGDSGGGQYVLNIKEAFIQLTWATIENTVLERFGSKAARIFRCGTPLYNHGISDAVACIVENLTSRLVKAKQFAEQEQIQQIVMIPAKEAKLHTYRLLQENFLQMQELRKTMSTNQPNKTFFLFHIDLNQVARMLLEKCYQAIYNAMTRREHEKSENRRLIEKQQRIASITQNLHEQGATAEQLAEIEEMLTPPERTLVEKVRTTLNKLSMSELQLDETLFILQLFLTY